jgi:negative regulator of sigma E activity
MNDIERLNAYLDRQLPPDEALAFETELAANPALAKQLEALRAVDAALRAPFDAKLNEPIPERFLHALQKPVEQVAQQPAEILNFSEAKVRRDAVLSSPKRRLWASWSARGAIAASVAVGLIAVTQLQPSQSKSDAVEVALNETPSGISVQLAGGETLMPRLSFAARDGRYCREFDLAAETSIACRSGKGWRIEGSVKSGGGANNDRFATATGSGQALDAIYARLGAGDPLGKAQERAVIARKWQ